MKKIILSLLLIASVGSLTAFSQTTDVYANTNNQPMKVQKINNIQSRINKIKSDYNVEMNFDSINDLTEENLDEIENSIKNSLKALEKAKEKFSKEEQVSTVSKVSQTVNGTAKVSAIVPLGLVNILIPYKYTMVQAGGAPPYFTNASAQLSYVSAGISYGSWAAYSSWTKVWSSGGRQNNKLDICTDGVISYSILGAVVTLPKQTFKKTLSL